MAALNLSHELLLAKVPGGETSSSADIQRLNDKVERALKSLA
jgi:hypothetical protein